MQKATHTRYIPMDRIEAATGRNRRAMSRTAKAMAAIDIAQFQVERAGIPNIIDVTADVRTTEVIVDFVIQK